MVLLEDSERVPDVFLGFGAIPQSELSDWLKRHSLVLPSDLVELWQLTGGGDVFESETILRPSVPTPPSESFIQDDIEIYRQSIAVRKQTLGLFDQFGVVA